jgi:hypothetical protein
MSMKTEARAPKSPSAKADDQQDRTHHANAL